MRTLFPSLLLWIGGLGGLLASDLNFTFVNATPRSFEAVYLSATTDKDWDGNLLTKGRPLAAGGKLAVHFDDAPKVATWDFHLVDSDGVAVRLDKVNLIDVDTVTLREIDGKFVAAVE